MLSLSLSLYNSIHSPFWIPDGATNTRHGRFSEGPPTRIDTPPAVPVAHPNR